MENISNEVFVMNGLNKKRSHLGKWLDERGITQKWLSEKSGLNKNTISRITSRNKAPNGQTMQKVLEALRTIDKNVEASDFWDL